MVLGAAMRTAEIKIGGPWNAQSKGGGVGSSGKAGEGRGSGRVTNKVVWPVNMFESRGRVLLCENTYQLVHQQPGSQRVRLAASSGLLPPPPPGSPPLRRRVWLPRTLERR